MKKIKFNNDEPKTVDDFISKKVEKMLEQSDVETKKRRNIEDKLYKQYSLVIEDEFRYLASVNDLSQFPRYSGRGIQEHAPDIKGSLADSGFTSMTLWYSDVFPEEVKDYKELLISNNFKVAGNEYTKETSDTKYYVMVEYSESTKNMRLYHTISKNK